MKEEIVREYLGKGKLLTPEALDMLLKGDKINQQGGAVVTGHDIKSGTREKNFQVIKNIVKKKKELTTDDFVYFFKIKYEKLRNILVDRLQKKFISLNKLDNYRNEVYVVGIVRSVKEDGEKRVVEIEDTTASVPIIFDKETAEGVELDDVLAVRAVSAKQVLFGKQVIYPDVPLRQPVTGHGVGCFVASLHLDEAPKQDAEKFFSWFENAQADFLFVSGDIGDKEDFEKYVERYCRGKTVFVIPGSKDSTERYPQTPLKFGGENIVSLSNPSLIEINGLKVLMINEFDTDFLKKRYLGKKTIINSDYLVLDELPDIAAVGKINDPYMTNHKSVTIVSSGSMLANFKPIVVDFSTRDTKQVTI